MLFRSGDFDLYVKVSSGATPEELLLEAPGDQLATSWSPDGRFLAYNDTPKGASQGDIWVLPLLGDRKPIPFVQTQFSEWDAHFSPDGHWLAYVSNESGRPEVYIAPFPGPGGKWQVSTAGGILPRWRRDGRELFYVALDNQLMAAEIKLVGSTVHVGARSEERRVGKECRL